MAKKKDQVPAEPATLPLCPYAKFTPRHVPRADIKGAPYNPRTITTEARKKLKANLKTVGLLGGIIWNRRTGNLVAGHQRLGVLDSLMGTKDYLVPVDEVDLDEKTEKEQNVFLNNPHAQGEWDADKLESMIKGLDIAATGFDASLLVDTFGADIMGGQEAPALQEMADRLRESQEMYDRIKKEGGTKRDDNLFYRVVVFESREKAEWLADLLSQPGEVFLEGRRLRDMVKEMKGDGEAGAADADERGDG